MGRKKVEIKRIENKSSRQVTFCKRRNGLIEKARQLSVLCESSVAVFVVSATGKLYNSSSGDNNNLEELIRVHLNSLRTVTLEGIELRLDEDPIWYMAKILKHYEVQHADKLKTLCLNIVKTDQHRGTLSFTAVIALETLRQVSKLDLTEKTQNYVSLNELLETVQRKIEAANVDNISVQSLIFLEEQFKTALSLTRARKTELMMQLVKSLQEKEKLLRDENTVLASQLAEMGKEKEFLETEDERAMLLEYSSGNNPRETLPLLK
uniref:Uncharacterized protein n=1 Tax=Brassica campestris TaxID=3711 RepID=A0A3P5YIQ4_BRACM|nr:unnamed protein product [Brassica rapa]